MRRTDLPALMIPCVRNESLNSSEMTEVRISSGMVCRRLHYTVDIL